MKSPSKSKKNRVTLKLVAQHVGVHPSTVSRSLNPSTRSMVMPAVAERVLDVARSLGYRPDPVAASLRTGRSKLIAIFVPDISNSVFAPILSGASEKLATEGYAVIVADVGSDKKRQLELASSLLARRVEGFIIATVTKEDSLAAFCVDQGLPAVLVNRAELRPRLSSVVPDDELSMSLGVDHLVALGHQTIGHIAGPLQHSTGYLRRRGFVRAMARHGLADRASYQCARNYSREAGVEAARKLLDQNPSITGILAANDLLAVGVYDVLHERGIRCPEDISVVGHNDMQLVDMIEPPLTSIRIDNFEMGRKAADLLQQAIEVPNLTTRKIMLQPTLIIRSSTAARNADGEIQAHLSAVR